MKHFLEEHHLQQDDHWDWNALEPEASFIFNGGIDPDQLAIVLDLEPALLFTEHLPSLTKDNPGGLGNNFEAFEAMKKKFLPKYKPHDVAATEQPPKDPNEIDQISKSIGIKASTLFSKQGHAQEEGDHRPQEHRYPQIWEREGEAPEDRQWSIRGQVEQRPTHAPVEGNWQQEEEDEHDQQEEEEDQQEEGEHDPQEDESYWHPYSGHDPTPNEAAMMAGLMENGDWEEGDRGEHHEEGEEDPNEWQHE